MNTCFHPSVHQTMAGTYYLKEAGVALLQMPSVKLDDIQPFLDGFAEDLGFRDYLKDPTPIGPTETLLKFAGQLCYMSLDEARTKNAEADRYFSNIRSSGHGSVLEHTSYSFLLYGISRSLTHELVRHRAGVAYSQLSQRYVDGKKLRFVERAEYQTDAVLHAMFEEWIDAASAEYDKRAQRLLDTMPFPAELNKRDRRKMVNQATRACLPNETEAPIVFTANVRALRHILEMRCSGPAEREIRDLTYKIYAIVRGFTNQFDDYTVIDVPQGGKALDTTHKKV